MKTVTAEKLPQRHSTDFQGLPVIIEWPRGCDRIGTKPDGTPFKTEMKADYGYIPDTTAAGDQERLDVYIGDYNSDSPYAYIVEQLTEDGEFDEYKILLGFDTLERAEETYLEHVDEKLLGDISEVEFDYLFDVVREKQKEAADKKEAAEQKRSALLDQGGTIEHCTGEKVGVRLADGTVEEFSKEALEIADKTAAGEKYTVIQAFLKNYKHEVDFYEEVATLVQDKLSQALQDAGIKAVVSSRAKSPERLEKKLYKRDKKRHYQTFREIYDDIIDLAGCRVALYMPADRDVVGQIIDKLFVSVRAPKNFPESSKPEEGDTLGYTATHYLVRLRPETLRKKELRYADTQIEIQVASVLMHAWAEVTHDLIYKPEKGSLTPEEQKALQNLNVLVKEGEKQLEELQASMERRDGESLRFDVTAALAGALKDRSAGKTASLTLGALKNALDVVAEPVRPSVWASYAQATATLRKARWQKQDVVSPKTRERWESAGVLGDETHFLNEAMAKLAPGKPINTLWVQPNRNEIIALAQQLKVEAKNKQGM